MDYDADAPYERERSTVCVSTQAGCAMGCVFCATGQQGFTRNLTPAEILTQVLHFTRSGRVTNVVFMGMGEPLANTAATIAAVRWLVHADGLDMRARGITVSTVGLRAGIRRLAAEGLQVGLTISLHAPDDELRRHLIPTAAGTSIDELISGARVHQRERPSGDLRLRPARRRQRQRGASAAVSATAARAAGTCEPDPVQPDRGSRPASPVAGASAGVPARAADRGDQRDRPSETRRGDRHRPRDSSAPTTHRRRCWPSPDL